MNIQSDNLSPWGRRLTAVLMLLFAVALLVGGVWLVVLGGTPYYVLSGLVLLCTAVGWWKHRAWSLWLYVFWLAVTLVWGVWEAGTDFWALAPRVDIWVLLAVWLLLPFANRQLSGLPGVATAKKCTAAVIAAVIVVLVYSVYNDPQEINGSFVRSQPQRPTQKVAGVSDEDWPAYGRTQAGVRYSPLNQINSDNVHQLQVAWTYHTGDMKTDQDSGETTYEVTPIKVGNTLFLCTAHQFLDAVDAVSGKRLWRFDPKLGPTKTYQHMTCRGVSYYDEATAAAANPQSAAAARAPASLQCPRKVILPVNDGRLIAVNADSGKPCSDFGNNGTIDLRRKMPYDYPGGYNPTSPPIVTANTIIIGGSVTDNYSSKEPSGVIRGYDVHSGSLKWVFDTGAQDPNAMLGEHTDFTHNSPNAWAPLAYDAERDLVYVPTGVGTPDIWGGNRTPLKERYANSVLALNATTGKLVWHFQTTHHDLWDMDVPSQPTLADITVGGRLQPAILVLTKTGNLFVLNRENGKPIVPVQEKPVPQTVARGPQTAGEHYSPTQPFTDINLAPKERLSGKQMWGATMFDQMVCRIMFHRLNYDGIYTPPSENGTLVFPGNLGVFEWGGLSYNPDRQVAVMNPLALPFVSQLHKMDPARKEIPPGAGTEQGLQPMYGTPYSVDIHPFLSPLGLPCKQPGWGYIAGVDMQTRQIVWKKRIGTIRDSLPNLMQLPPLTIGVPGLGGTISTAGNVMFVAATQDNYIRAFDVTDGKMLWEARLPAGGQATPMTYMAGGRQYVVIMAGGHSSFGTKLGDALVAYALPETAQH